MSPLAVPLAMEIRRAVREVPGVSRQAMRVEGYGGSDELNALLSELAGESVDTCAI